MMKAPTPLNENLRIQALEQYELLDTECEFEFDQMTSLVSKIFNVPICLISLVDKNRQWFKSHFGLDVKETPREISYCGHAIMSEDIFIIPNSFKDDRFKDNPLACNFPNVVFYAGMPLVDKNNFIIGTLCLIDHVEREFNERDISLLKILAQQTMHLIQTRLESIKQKELHQLLIKTTENVPGFIYTFRLSKDGHSSFPFCSEHIFDIYEVTPNQVKHDASIVYSRIHPDDYHMVVSTISESMEHLTDWNCEYRVLLPTLGEKWVKGHSTPERTQDGDTLWYGHIHDITNVKNQDEIISRTTKYATLGEMAAEMAHEINNPLLIIKTAAGQSLNMIKRGQIIESKLKDYLEKINLTTDRISKIIKGIKFFSGSQNSDLFTTENLYTVLEDTLSLCREKFHKNLVDLHFEFPEDFEEINIECKSVELSQVILNLLNNAYDAIESFDPKWVNVQVTTDEHHVTISITDCGLGISPEIEKKLFHPFFTTKPRGKGTGLGLSIVQKIIEAHHGKIFIDRSQKNTCFKVVIPKTQNTHLKDNETKAA